MKEGWKKLKAELLCSVAQLPLSSFPCHSTFRSGRVGGKSLEITSLPCEEVGWRLSTNLKWRNSCLHFRLHFRLQTWNWDILVYIFVYIFVYIYLQNNYFVISNDYLPGDVLTVWHYSSTPIKLEALHLGVICLLEDNSLSWNDFLF